MDKCYFLDAEFGLSKYYTLYEIAYNLGFTVINTDTDWRIFRKGTEAPVSYSLEWRTESEVLSDYIQELTTQEYYGFKIYKAIRL